MRIDALVAEIGSTTTTVTAFDGLDRPVPRRLGQGMAATTVEAGDVTVGLAQAQEDLRRRLRQEELQAERVLAAASAAGGLRMTVHGLVKDMTVRAAREAALGAGAVVKAVTAGKMSDGDLQAVISQRPNIILLAGGVDHGEKETILHNARCLAKLPAWGVTVPVVFAGNIAARQEAVAILSAGGLPVPVVDNVYPRLDELVVGPARAAIQAVFEEHIVQAPGMERIRESVDGPIMPTPAAVLRAAEYLAEQCGDLLVVDVGGATTDVHSVTEQVHRLALHPEPHSKRTVEGDLGVYVNAQHVVELIGPENLAKELGEEVRPLLAAPVVIPRSDLEVAFVERLAREASRQALRRHAGQLRTIYGPSGRITVAEGRDLSAVRWIIGTGGPLTALPGGRQILQALKAPGNDRLLWPGEGAQVLIDRHYILAALGLLLQAGVKNVLPLALSSFGIPSPLQ
ncbi:MAG TPA: DNA mismatch repair protein MutL [Firmicutes bacterium]|nr:DNA mismatch repair protein MutL [Bacillota bacterium]